MHGPTQDAFTWFTNLDKLIKHVNLDGRVHVFYSTPGRYIDAKKSEQITWPLKVRREATQLASRIATLGCTGG